MIAPRKPRSQKLSPTMIATLEGVLRSEAGYARLNDRAPYPARSGIVRDWEVNANTHAALISRGMLTPAKFFGHASARRVQITKDGCEAIGRSMDEIVAWAWDAAHDEYSVRALRGDYVANLMHRVPTTSAERDCPACNCGRRQRGGSHTQQCAILAWERRQMAAHAPVDTRVADVEQARHFAVGEYFARGGTLARLMTSAAADLHLHREPGLPRHTHYRQIGSARLNLCAETGGEASDQPTCPDCVRLLAEADDKDVHTEHCCITHGCKYGPASRTPCTVVSGEKRQSTVCQQGDEMGEPCFPQGTPQYDEYAAELRTELGKWKRGEGEYTSEKPEPVGLLALVDALEFATRAGYGWTGEIKAEIAKRFATATDPGVHTGATLVQQILDGKI